jgi:hypothetical protein
MPSLEELAQPRPWGLCPEDPAYDQVSTCVAIRVDNIPTDKSRTIDVSILEMLI